MLLDCFFKSKENYLTNQKHIRIIVQYENLGDRMKIQLSKIISVPKYEETVEASIDLNEIKLKGVSYPIREKNDFSIVFRNIGKDKISFAFETEVTLGIPCSRCLEEVSLRSMRASSLPSSQTQPAIFTRKHMKNLESVEMWSR